MCIERLSQLINLSIEHKISHQIKIASIGPHLSHLCFVDDIILFAKATKNQVKAIQEILELFCRSSGQRINSNKSCIFFLVSRNICLNKQKGIKRFVWFPPHLKPR